MTNVFLASVHEVDKVGAGLTVCNNSQWIDFDFIDSNGGKACITIFLKDKAYARAVANAINNVATAL